MLWRGQPESAWAEYKVMRIDRVERYIPVAFLIAI